MGKQLRIAGTNRPGIPEIIEEASEDLIGARRTKRAVLKTETAKVKTAEWKVLTLMQEHGVKQLTVKDPDTEELLSFDLKEVLRISKTGEVGDGDEGEEVLPKSSSPPPSDIHPGLIAQANKAQADAGVFEDSEGDVIPPESSTPKTKKAKAKRASKKGK